MMPKHPRKLVDDDNKKELYSVVSIAKEDRNPRPPHDCHVILARGRSAFSHPGNKRFRRLMADWLDAYSNATTKKLKSRIVSEIIDQVRLYGADFLKQNPKSGKFHVVSDRVAREKVGQGLRDALHYEYKSSTKAKQRKRNAAQRVQDGFMYAVISQNAKVMEIIEEVASQLNSNDECMEDLFLQSNIKILDELKASNAAAAYVRASTSDVAASDDDSIMTY